MILIILKEYKIKSLIQIKATAKLICQNISEAQHASEKYLGHRAVGRMM